MILVDSSVWIDHLRNGDPGMTGLLERGGALVHPFVIGELALGTLRQRDTILGALHDLPRATVADDAEVIGFITRQGLHGRGIGYVDAHLLASARLTAGAALWTRDRRLHAVATELGVAAAGTEIG